MEHGRGNTSDEKSSAFQSWLYFMPNKTNASFEEWLTDGRQCSNLKNQETHAEAPEPNLPITGNFIDVAW